MRAIQVRRFGGPEVLEYTELSEPKPVDGEVLVDVARAGVNYMDIIQRVGRELDHPHAARPPFVMGVEGAGRVVECGSDVKDLEPGDRVAWAFAQGSYAERVVVDSLRAVLIPNDITDEVAASLMQQGITAHFLATSSYPICDGETALVHAGAGGVGLLLTQLIKARGGRVITTVSSADKERASRAVGADEVIRYDMADVANEVMKITDRRGVHVVYDGVGQAVFRASLASLAPRGYLVYYGAASGAIPPFDPDLLQSSGSLYLTRPSMAHYTQTKEEFVRRAYEVFGWVRDGTLQVRVGHSLPLAEAAAAHRLMDSRQNVGKLLLQNE